MRARFASSKTCTCFHTLRARSTNGVSWLALGDDEGDRRWSCARAARSTPSKQPLRRARATESVQTHPVKRCRSSSQRATHLEWIRRARERNESAGWEGRSGASHCMRSHRQSDPARPAATERTWERLLGWQRRRKGRDGDRERRPAGVPAGSYQPAPSATSRSSNRTSIFRNRNASASVSFVESMRTLVYLLHEAHLHVCRLERTRRKVRCLAFTKFVWQYVYSIRPTNSLISLQYAWRGKSRRVIPSGVYTLHCW